jgi:hypothetical protein
MRDVIHSASIHGQLLHGDETRLGQNQKSHDVNRYAMRAQVEREAARVRANSP